MSPVKLFSNDHYYPTTTADDYENMGVSIQTVISVLETLRNWTLAYVIVGAILAYAVSELACFHVALNIRKASTYGYIVAERRKNGIREESESVDVQIMLHGRWFVEDGPRESSSPRQKRFSASPSFLQQGAVVQGRRRRRRNGREKRRRF